MDDIRAKTREYKQQLISALPEYAFKRDDGDRYISARFMIEIEDKVDSYEKTLMEDHIKRLETEQCLQHPE